MVKNRIAILADFPWSYFDKGALGRGGGQGSTWLTQLAEIFAGNSEFEIHWVTLDRTRWRGKIEHRTWKGQQFHLLPAGKLSVDLALRLIPSRLRLKRFLNTIKPDLVHCWGTERAYPQVCATATFPSILSMQGILTHLLKINVLHDSWVWKTMAALEPRYLRTATVVTCESQWAIHRVKEAGANVDARQVEYGVHPSFYQIKWKPNESKPYLLFVGSITSAKGVDVLFDALEILGPRKWILKLAGDGGQRSELETRKIPGVEWLGTLAWEELQKELAGATCLIHPTRADSSPNVVKEARVIGLPVVTTIHGGQAGYIQHGENGLIVDPLDAEPLALAISKVMNDVDLARKLGAMHHERDRKYFEATNTANEFCKIYRELIKVKIVK